MKHRLVRARAPLRLGLGGGGTDVSPYCDQHGGHVLNMAIDRFAHVTLRRRDDGGLTLNASDMQNVWSGPALDALGPETGAPSLMRGVYNRFVRDYHGGRPLPVDVVSYADAPAGSGLGTSSALVVALVAAFARLLDVPLDARKMARLAFDIERVDLGLSGGRQDQYAAAFGGVNFMEFYENERAVINTLRLSPAIQHELESCLVIYFTGASRESANIIDEQRRNMSGAQGQAPIDALHELKYAASTMKEALLEGDIQRLAALLGESWAAKQKTARNVTTSEIGEAYETAMRAGALGGKVSGAGGGGFMFFLIDPCRREDLIRALRARGGHPETCHICPHGAESWRVE